MLRTEPVGAEPMTARHEATIEMKIGRHGEEGGWFFAAPAENILPDAFPRMSLRDWLQCYYRTGKQGMVY